MNITKEDLNSGKVLIDFWAEWCGPCKVLGPVVNRFAESQDEIKVVKVDVDENHELCGEFGIRNVPTIFYMEDGEVIEKAVGKNCHSLLQSLSK